MITTGPFHSFLPSGTPVLWMSGPFILPAYLFIFCWVSHHLPSMWLRYRYIFNLSSLCQGSSSWLLTLEYINQSCLINEFVYDNFDTTTLVPIF
jgi:hypothetical protein